MSDLVYNHVSSRVPGEEGRFLINAYGMHEYESVAIDMAETRRLWGPLEWPALLRMLDRRDPGFRQ